MTEPSRRRFRFGLRAMFVAVATLSIAAAYFGSYYRISRRCVAEQGDETIFWYVVPEAPTYDESRHHQLRWLYAPANFLDRTIFHGPLPARSGTFELN